MPALSVDTIVELEITDVAYGGDGVGRVDGCVVFVPFTITGERVRARIVKRRKRYFFAELIDVISPAPDRCEPFCPHYTICGGCQYQHTAYPAQLVMLKKQLQDMLEHLGHFPPELPIADMLPSPKTREYRNRIDLHPGQDDIYGFCIRGTRPPEIFAFECCPIFELQQDFSRYPLRRPGQLLVVRTHDGNPYCYFKDDHNNVQSGPFDLAGGTPLSSNDIWFSVDGRKLKTAYSGFFQVNRSAVPGLVNTVKAFVRPKPSDTLLDVYCGVGLFGLSLAPDVKRVLGVEQHEESIVYARENAREFGFSHCEFTAEAAETYLRRLYEQQEHIDVCILDPPRNGLTNKVVSSIKKIRPATLVYVSCGPSTFARDARKFVDAGYELTAIQPLDLFPQTKHFELVGLFQYTISDCHE